jgi:hypothetical protein
MAHKMPRAKSGNDVQITALIPSEWVDKLDARAAVLSGEGMQVTRADVVRMLLKRGLEEGEKPKKR